MSDPINYVDPFGLTNYVAGNQTYVINDGCNETINLSRRQFRKLFSQFYDFHGDYWSMRQSIMDKNGYTDAAGNPVLAVSQITSGGNSSFSPLSILSSIFGLSGDAMSNSNYTYRLTNSNKELDFVMYKNGWTGNQYVRTNKVSSLGKNIGRTGSILGLYSLLNSVMEFNETSNIDGKISAGLNISFDAIAFIPGYGPVISLGWTLGGNKLFNSYVDYVSTQIDSIGYPGIPVYFDD